MAWRKCWWDQARYRLRQRDDEIGKGPGGADDEVEFGVAREARHQTLSPSWITAPFGTITMPLRM